MFRFSLSMSSQSFLEGLFSQFLRQILLFQGYDSNDIFFEIKGRGEGQKIIREKSKMEAVILNDTTIRSTFTPDEVGIFDVRWVVVLTEFLVYFKPFHYRCRINIRYEDCQGLCRDSSWDRGRDGSELVQRGVCDQKIHVGCKLFCKAFDP